MPSSPAEDPSNDRTVPVPSRHPDASDSSDYILAKTENRWMGFVSVLFAYGAWGVANAVGCVVAMEAVRSGAWAGVVLWFGACIAWNACLFRSRPVPRRAKVA